MRKGMEKQYTPAPVDTSDVKLGAEIEALCERLAENTHDIWARGRMDEGWRYGPVLDREKKTHPSLVPYAQLPESEKEYDRRTSQETVKVLMKLGFEILPAREM